MFESVVWKRAAIVSRPLCVKLLTFVDADDQDMQGAKALAAMVWPNLAIIFQSQDQQS